MSFSKLPMKLLRVATAKLGQHKNHPRLYIAGQYLADAGFTPSTRMTMQVREGEIVLSVSVSGEKVVSRKKRGDKYVALIDILSDKLKSVLRSDEIEIRIHKNTLVLRPERTARAAADRSLRPVTNTCGSLFAGGGLLSLAARQAGYKERFAVEIDPSYAEVYSDNFPQSLVLNQSVHEVNTEDLPHVDLLIMGIPCEPFARSRRSGKGYVKGSAPEAHALGDMTYWALRIIEAVNPKSIVIEEGPDFLQSGAGWICKHALSRMGYRLYADVLDSGDFGSLQHRRRAVIVATTDEYSPPAKSTCQNKISDILESIDHDWFDRDSKRWLYDHWDRQSAKGNNFSNGLVLANDATKVRSIKKRYLAIQGDNPVLQSNEGSKHRLFTLTELRRLFEVDDNYQLNTSKTRAGEILGQGVIVGLFRQIIEAIGRNTTGFSSETTGFSSETTRFSSETTGFSSETITSLAEPPLQASLFG